ncbi:SDR family NAD(P)-dependent oxidoreductase [Noviherbaspirillum sp. Root189]|uniref:SDR family NAD(P)-dependent oxidoreductase n=1 Tax=Noviherbaspirillum sp. Root189 TaxID=1736487 RepID=UPI0007100B3D|nr:SDR family NAD(P)-dependent oxidoreductase [Noviherbaspirillum sp. Root189]KRB88954.1 short-chain dehydrogenase [Noviherbaspirillum sp. Root189]
MKNKKRIVIIGATSAIAEHCARLWTERENVDLTLVGRDGTRIERVAADLRVRNSQSIVRTMSTRFDEPAAIQAAADSIVAAGAVDVVLIAHGSLPDQKVCESDLAACQNALEINAVSPVLFAEAFAGHMAKANQGTLIIIGSVAGDRGRKSNYVYGAAKGLVTRYAQGLQHRFAGTDIRVVLIKPGPTDTPMTAQLKSQGAKLASVEDVAMRIVKAADTGRAVAYVPGKWQLIMLVIKHLPSRIFNKLNI